MDRKNNLKIELLIIFIALFSLIHVHAFAQDLTSDYLFNLSNSQKLKDPNIVHKAFSGGTAKARFIIMLKEPTNSQKTSCLHTETAKENRRKEVQKAQDNLLNNLQKVGPEQITNKFKYIYGFSVEVTLEQLKEILEQEEVESVEEDSILYPHLAQGIPLMSASTARDSYNGSGISIAICDTGIDYTHSRLGGGSFPNSKVIGGYDCGDNDSDPMDEEGHGTCCAGIAAGENVTSGDYIGGVAYNAKLYAVKISYGSDGSAFTSDMIEGWEWCITHQNDNSNNPIMIISTSFGGGRYYSSCDSYSSAMTTAAANAVSAGMALFVSSGNDGYCDSIGWPACISHVISVGAVYDAAFGNYYPCVNSNSCATKYATGGCSTGYYSIDSTSPDMVPSYSNTASFLGLLAPSNQAYTTDITGSGGYTTGDYYSSFGGTSAACPYAAGAAACLQTAAKAKTGSFLTPVSLKAKLINNGDSITDPKVSITKPRVNLGAAVNTLGGGDSGNEYDFNGDGNSDILWREITTGQVAIWLMNGKTILRTGSPGTVS
ncbi:hypothetical protein DRQ25_13530, partial [Candidatus Fermentibacteria bacterium]